MRKPFVNGNGEKKIKKTLSLPAVGAVSLAAFLLGTAAGGIGRDVPEKTVRETAADGAVEDAVYLFFHDNYRGVSGECAATDAALLREKVIYDGPQDVGQDSEASVFQRFLNGEASVRIREGVWDDYEGGTDEAWTIQELLDMVCGYYLEDRGLQTNSGYGPSVRYTYLDCGGDGVEELAIRFVGVGIESTEDLTMVIACRDAALEVVYARHSWSRSSNELRYHGCIRHHGSGGARDNYGGMDYIDGNGDLQMVYSVHAVGCQGWALCELEDYDDTNASEYAFTDTTYVIGDREYTILEFEEDIPEEIGREYIDYLKQKGENIITEEEVEGLIEARMEQLGIEKTWAEEEEPAWSYCYW